MIGPAVAGLLAAAALVAVVAILAMRFGARGRLLGERAAVSRLLSDYRTMLEDLGAVVWEFDLEAEAVTFVSESARHVLGYDLADWHRMQNMWLDKTHPDDRGRLAETLQALQRDPGRAASSSA